MPEFIDPLQCAEKRRAFKGEIALSALPRLVEVLADSAGQATVSMAFDKQGSLAVLEGHVSAMLHLVCQKCLEVFPWPVDADFKLGIVASPDEANLLPEAFEPLLVKEDKTPFKDIIEEELLLAIPAFPKHAEGDCSIDKTPYDAATPEREGRMRRDNPFSVLAKLKNTGDS